jgi:ZIP family zinc transporter
MNDIWFALGLTLFAGMATGLGSIAAFTARRTNYRFLSVSTGFSAGVMVYVSFVEILPKGLAELSISYGTDGGPWVNTAAFFGGMLLIGLIDNLIPAAENPHETHSEEEIAPLSNPAAPVPEFHFPAFGVHDHGRRRLLRTGLFTAVAIAIHNFPEGLATFAAALQDPVTGMAIAFAVALHNIPEGISVSVPIYYATGDRGKAFVYSFLSGLAEPFGAGVAYLLLLWVAGGTLADLPPGDGTGLWRRRRYHGVHQLDELLPTSRAYGKGHDSLLGLAGGMLIMAKVCS